jgi:hypothetical protein
MADNRTAQQKALDDEAEALKAEAQTVEDQDQAESDEQATSTPSTSSTAAPADQTVAPEDLVVTNTGVDLTATDTGTNPQAAQALENNKDLPAAVVATLAADPTPSQEAVAAGSNVEAPVGNPTPLQTNPVGMAIDASGLNVTTNQDVIDNFPKNENGQVEIGEDGKIVGLDDSQQPNPAATAQE